MRLRGAWLDASGITDGPVLRKISCGNRALPHPLHPESVNDLVQAAVARAGLQGGPYSAHSLRAGFVTYAHLRGASDRAIAHQTRHRSLATLGMCVRIHEAWEGQLVVQMHSLRRQLGDKKALPVEVFEQAGTCSPTTRVLVGVDDGVDVVGVRPSAATPASGWPPVQGRHRGRRWAPGRSPVWPPRRPRILDVAR